MSIKNISRILCDLQNGKLCQFEFFFTQDKNGGVSVKKKNNNLHIPDINIEWKIVEFHSSIDWPFISDPRPTCTVRDYMTVTRWGLDAYQLENVQVCDGLNVEMAEIGELICQYISVIIRDNPTSPLST